MLQKDDYIKILEFTFEMNQYFNDLTEESMANSSIDHSIYFRLHVLNLLSEIFGFNNSAFFIADENEYYANPIGKTNEAFNKFLQLYDQHYYKRDIFQLINLPKNLLSKSVLTASDVKPYTEYLFNEYFRDFNNSGYYDILALPFMNRNKVIGGIGIYTSKETEQFTDKDIETLSILNPHITQSLATCLRISQITFSQNIIKEWTDTLPVGLIVLDKRYAVSYFNDTAKEFCKDIVINNEVKPKSNMDTPNIYIQHVLYQLLSKNFFDNINQNLAKEISTNQYSFTVNALASKSKHHAYVVNMVKNIDKRIDLLEKSASLYNLTKRELEIVNLITKGYTNKEISDILYVSTHTVRSHVSNIFKKMEINHRSAISNKITGITNQVGGKK